MGASHSLQEQQFASRLQRQNFQDQAVDLQARRHHLELYPVVPSHRKTSRYCRQTIPSCIHIRFNTTLHVIGLESMDSKRIFTTADDDGDRLGVMRKVTYCPSHCAVASSVENKPATQSCRFGH